MSLSFVCVSPCKTWFMVYDENIVFVLCEKGAICALSWLYAVWLTSACVFVCMLWLEEGPNILQLQKKLKVLPVQILSTESFLFVAWPGILLQKPCVLWVYCLSAACVLCTMVVIVPCDEFDCSYWCANNQILFGTLLFFYLISSFLIFIFHTTKGIGMFALL